MIMDGNTGNLLARGTSESDTKNTRELQRSSVECDIVYYYTSIRNRLLYFIHNENRIL